MYGVYDAMRANVVRTATRQSLVAHSGIKSNVFCAFSSSACVRRNIGRQVDSNALTQRAAQAWIVARHAPELDIL
jgi:hypothetical protein